MLHFLATGDIAMSLMAVETSDMPHVSDYICHQVTLALEASQVNWSH